jgi:EAL domain-containing protein (putative c-di-GMP-specific phosphodiesterase class I)
LGDWVLREACAQLCRWQSEGIALPPIAVNVSVRQFRQKRFIDKVAKIIGESGVPASAVDIVKIDCAFVKDLPADEGSMAITEAIIGMAHALLKQVVAEGVATAEQLRVMRRLRCDFIQGYHLSVPLEASGFAALMRQREGYPALVKLARA